METEQLGRWPSLGPLAMPERHLLLHFQNTSKPSSTKGCLLTEDPCYAGQHFYSLKSSSLRLILWKSPPYNEENGAQRLSTGLPWSAFCGRRHQDLAVFSREEKKKMVFLCSCENGSQTVFPCSHTIPDATSRSSSNIES